MRLEVLIKGLNHCFRYYFVNLFDKKPGRLSQPILPKSIEKKGKRQKVRTKNTDQPVYKLVRHISSTLSNMPHDPLNSVI